MSGPSTCASGRSPHGFATTTPSSRVMMVVNSEDQPAWKMNGLVFSGLAGAMGAVGAICVIFASKAATDTAKGEFDDRVSELTCGGRRSRTPGRRRKSIPN